MSHRPRITSRPLASSRTYDTVGAKFLRKAAMIATATTMTACASTTKVEHKPLFNPDPVAKQASWEGQRYMFDHKIKVVQSEEEYKAVLLVMVLTHLFELTNYGRNNVHSCGGRLLSHE